MIGEYLLGAVHPGFFGHGWHVGRGRRAIDVPWVCLPVAGDVRLASCQKSTTYHVTLLVGVATPVRPDTMPDFASGGSSTATSGRPRRDMPGENGGP